MEKSSFQSIKGHRRLKGLRIFLSLLYKDREKKRNKDMIANFAFEEFVDLVFEKCLWVIGGYENTMSDSEEGSSDYVYAENIIKDLDAILDEAFDELEFDLKAKIELGVRALVCPNVIFKLHKEGY